MKILFTGSVLGLAMVGVMWVALDSVTASLRYEMSAKLTHAVVNTETGYSELTSGYRLTTQHLQPAYNTVQRTATLSE